MKNYGNTNKKTNCSHCRGIIILTLEQLNITMAVF